MPQNVLQQLTSRAPLVAAITTFVAGIVTIAYALYKQRKAASAASVPPPAPGAAVPRPSRVAKGALVRIYDDFLDELPSSYRRSTTNFQPIVVLGNEGSGQSELVTRFTSWERESKAFVPSSVGETDLRIYMGSHVMVHELSSTVFADTSKDARIALERLFRPLFRVRRPIVVLTIDVNDVLEGDPSALVGLADLLRGKIHLLSQLHPRESVEVRVALMHFEKIPGFLAFSAFAKGARYPTVLRFEKGAFSESALHAQIDGIGRSLPLALVRCDASTYLQILELTRVLPTLGERLTTFLQQVASPIGRSTVPYLSEIHLVGPEGSAADPFHVSDADLLEPDRAPLRRHAFGAAAIASSMLAYFVLGLGLELHDFSTADTALDEATRSAAALDLERHDVLERERGWRHDVVALLDRREGWQRFLPSFVRSGPFGSDRTSPLMGVTLARVIESRMIVPQLRKLREPGQHHRRGPRSLYLIAILRSSTFDSTREHRRHGTGPDPSQVDKGMGELVAGQLTGWSVATGLPAEAIRDYLRLTTGLYDVADLRDELSPDGREPAEMPWEGLVEEVSAAISRGTVRPGELAAIRSKAAVCLPFVRGLSEYRELGSIVEILHQQNGTSDLVALVGYEHGEQLLMSQWATISGAGATGTLELLANSDLGPRDPTVARAMTDEDPPTNLPGLSSVLWAAKHHSPGAEIHPKTQAQAVVLGSQRFEPRRWMDVVLRSRVTMEIEGFLEERSSSEDVFFSSDSIPLATLDDSPFFATPEPLRPRYTRTSFDRNVHASVVELDAIVRELALPADDPMIRRLEELVTESMRAYGTRYAAANLRHLDEFGVHGLDNVEALRVVLGQMSSEGSPLDQVVSEVVDNTRIVLPENEVSRFAPVTEPLGRFAPLFALIGPDGAPTPAMQSYKQILSGAATALDGGQAPAAPAGGRGGAAPAPTADFSPVGLLALDQLHRDPASFAALVSQWANGLGLSASFRRPFLEPLRGIEHVGVEEINYATEDAWGGEISPALNGLLALYPFDASASLEATPAQITAVLHPTEGSLARFVAAYVEPVSTRRRDGSYRPRATRDGASLPRSVYQRINVALAMSRLFFAEDGTPQPLHVTVVPQLLETVRARGPSVTLGYLRAGDTTVFAFNQRSSEIDLTVDWTRRAAAQVGVQLRDPRTGGELAPRPIDARGYFALLRVLDRAERVGDRCVWTIGRNRSEIEFTVAADPTSELRRLGVE